MSESVNSLAALYVVATPIGNLEDMSPRAVSVLQQVSFIAAEDTRHSSRLLQHFGIKTRCVAYHDFSNQESTEHIAERLLAGESVALISDAGTPLISDPGYRLVAHVRALGLPVLCIPGASAVTAALSISGLATDRFSFEGFLPAKSVGRQAVLKSLLNESRTLVFYESPHRIETCLEDMESVFGAARRLFLGRELTKQFETGRLATVKEIREWVATDSNQRKGEFVLIVEGSKEDKLDVDMSEAIAEVNWLKVDMPLKKAVEITAKFRGLRKNKLYSEYLTYMKSAPDTE